MISKKVDIIIPVYNKREFLHDLVVSLNRLPKDLFNIIIVDDGSKDDSYKIILKLIGEKVLDNFYLYSKDNGGVSSARNYGLQKAVSEYIWFFDPDDNLHDDIFKNFDNIKNIEHDVVVFNFIFKIVEKNIVKKVVFENYGEISKNDFLINHDALLSESKNMNNIWNKWYKREFIKDISFDEKFSLGEDRLFNLDVFSKEGEALIYDITIYEYFLYGEGTLSSSLNEKKIKEIYDVNNINIKYLNYRRDACKKHIIDYIKIMTVDGKRSLFLIYKREHKNLNLKIMPLYSFSEFILLILLIFNLNILIYKVFKLLKK